MRWKRLLLVALPAVLVVSSLPWLWTELAADGHLHELADAPSADVVMVLGTEVGPDGVHPAERLAGRLETAAALVRDGRARTVLVSGDGGGESGDEPSVMTNYLVGLGVAADRIVEDRYGLDTYDSCARAVEVFRISRMLVVTQRYHLARAVTLCRSRGIDAEGVEASCPGCSRALLTEKALRDYLACGKAALDVVRDRPPAVR